MTTTTATMTPSERMDAANAAAFKATVETLNYRRAELATSIYHLAIAATTMHAALNLDHAPCSVTDTALAIATVEGIRDALRAEDRACAAKLAYLGQQEV
jgi:hypothetical protein